MIEHLDADFDTISTVYYNLKIDGNTLNTWARTVVSTQDGGALIVSNSTNISDRTQCWTTITKFPAEAFEGVEEAHENGLRVAIAYPNPGKDVLNIRTGLRNAWVEVYDLNGKLEHRRDITENVTAIDATGWPAGVYVWKVVSNGKEAETGKWIKE